MLVPRMIQKLIPAGFQLHRLERQGGQYGYTFRRDSSCIRVTTGMSSFAPREPQVSEPQLVWSDESDLQDCYEASFQLGIDGTAVHGQCFARSAPDARQLAGLVAHERARQAAGTMTAYS